MGSEFTLQWLVMSPNIPLVQLLEALIHTFSVLEQIER